MATEHLPSNETQAAAELPHDDASDASTAPSATNNVILESLRLDDSPETSNLRLRYETGLNATDTR
ncbi:MAG: hypothetical protein ACRDL7_07810, partial [Gaiellaceae bacterium]